MTSKVPYIFIIDDSIDLRELMAQFFESEGYEVQVAADGQEGLNKLREAQTLPCVILLDLMMPVMDGFKFGAEIARDERLSKVPLLIMTADANAEEKAKRVGAHGWLKKPVGVDTLIAVAEKFCVV